MSRIGRNIGAASVSLGALLFVLVPLACDDDGKTAPEKCADPALPIFDIQAAGAPADDNKRFPCVTRVGHAVSQILPASSAGKASGGTSSSSNDAGGAGAGGQ